MRVPVRTTSNGPQSTLLGYPAGPARAPDAATGAVLPLRYWRGDQELSFFSMSAAVSTATDVTVEELAIEAFCPADAATAAVLGSLSE